MRRVRESYGFTDPAPHRQVGWADEQSVWDRYAFFESFYRPGMRLLDVGCGNGLLYDWLQENGYAPDYWGMDASDEFLRQFKERHPEVESNLLQGSVTRPESALPALRGVLKEYDVATMFGVASDFGTGGTPKLRDLGEAVRNVMPLLREGGVLVMDFWDAALFRPVTIETMGPAMFLYPDAVKGVVPPTAWNPDEVTEFFEGVGLRYEMYRPVVGKDFGIVAYKERVRRADEQSMTSPLVVFDFADALLSDARRTSAAAVEKAVEGVADILRRASTDVRRSSRWQEHDSTFAAQIVSVMDSAASQVERQWRTTRRSVGLGEGVAWRFDQTIPADVAAFGPDRVRKSVDAVSATIESVVDDITHAARGMSFPVDSGLMDALDGALVTLQGEWQKVQREVWA